MTAVELNCSALPLVMGSIENFLLRLLKDKILVVYHRKVTFTYLSIFYILRNLQNYGIVQLMSDEKYLLK